MTSIGISAFDSCSGITSVTIPANVTSIGYMAFNTVNMAYVNYLGSTQPDCVENDPSAPATTFVTVDVACVPMDYASTAFCGTYKVYVKSCEEFMAQNNQC